MNDREEFEKKAKDVFCGYDFTFDEQTSTYASDEIDSAWIGWQAAIVSQAERISELASKVVAQQARIVELVRVAKVAKYTILDLSPCAEDACRQFQTEDVEILERTIDVALLNVDDLSALKEHDAKVLEEAHDCHDTQTVCGRR